MSPRSIPGHRSQLLAASLLLWDLFRHGKAAVLSSDALLSPRLGSPASWPLAKDAQSLPAVALCPPGLLQGSSRRHRQGRPHPTPLPHQWAEGFKPAAKCRQGVEAPSCCQTRDWRSWVGEVWLQKGPELSASRENGKGEHPCERGEVLDPFPGHWTSPATPDTKRKRMVLKGARGREAETGPA